MASNADKQPVYAKLNSKGAFAEYNDRSLHYVKGFGRQSKYHLPSARVSAHCANWPLLPEHDLIRPHRLLVLNRSQTITLIAERTDHRIYRRDGAIVIPAR